ncbi:MAG TPA: DinB family protein [Chloroflexota bacterium]|jgi:uncharacterized damage-inducible protein DinB
MSDLLVELYRHNLWANLRTADACAGLSDAQLDATVHGTAGSIRATLLHIAGAEQRYVNLLGGPPLAQRLHERDGWPGFEAFRTGLQQSGQALVGIAATADPARVLTATYQGNVQSLPISTVMIQVINHATEHRSHVATILTQQGVEPPDVSGWSYGESKLAR